ncbi:MAG: DUF3093 family protein [Chloroflexi bacterium]|nr:DUF3093 family protein [Chloroflexota bacterium]
MTDQKSDYYEQIRASGRVFAFLALLLGSTAGALTGVAIRGLFDEPVITGSSAVIFYAAFGLSTLITVFVMLNYTIMSLRVSDNAVEITVGMRRASVAIGEIGGVRVAETQSRMSRAMSAKGRKSPQMWTVMAVGSGVELEIAHGAGTRMWFVASRDPQALHAAIGSRLATVRGEDQPDADTPAPEPVSDAKP